MTHLRKRNYSTSFLIYVGVRVGGIFLTHLVTHGGILFYNVKINTGQNQPRRVPSVSVKQSRDVNRDSSSNRIHVRKTKKNRESVE